MKIVAQTADEMVLKEGSAKGIVTGAVLALAGIGVAAYAHFAPSAPLWVGIALFVVGAAMVLFSSSIAVDISKATGQIAYRTKRLVGGSAATFAVADVLRIETRQMWRTQNMNTGNRGMSAPQQVLVSQSVMVMKDGREVPLDHQNSPSNMGAGAGVLMGGAGREAAIANQVAAFLGVPFQEIAPPGGPVGINIGGGSGAGIQL